MRLGTVWIPLVLLAMAQAAFAWPSSGYTTTVLTDTELAGWDTSGHDGMQVAQGVLDVSSGSGRIRSRQVYADFHLHLEWKLSNNGGQNDLCIFFADGANCHLLRPGGIEIGLTGRNLGRPSLLQSAGTSDCRVLCGEWNTLDLTVLHDCVHTAVNGQPAYRFRGMAIPAGYLGLEIDASHGGRCQFRNIRITELGHTSLFNGTDLANWVATPDDGPACWSVEDGAIVCNGQRGPWLRSRREYEDFNLRLEYQVAANGNSGIYVRVPEDGNHHRENHTLPPAGFEVQILDDAAPKHADLKDYQYSASVYDIAGAAERVSMPAGQWNLLEINCLGHHVTCMHNGVKVVDAAPARYPLLKLRNLKGYLGLQNHGSVVKFRNLRIGPPVQEYPRSGD